MRTITERLATEPRLSRTEPPVVPTQITVIVKLVERQLPLEMSEDKNQKSLKGAAKQAALLKSYEARIKLYEEPLQKLRDLGLNVNPGFALPILIVSGTAEALTKLEMLPDVVSVQPNYTM